RAAPYRAPPKVEHVPIRSGVWTSWPGLTQCPRGQDCVVMSGEKRDGAPSRHGDVDTQLVASRYEIQELLGRGSMGAVYSARDVVLDRPVALKLFPSQGADPQQADRYEQEARLLARLSHPGLVPVYDAGIDAPVPDEPKPYLVMELINGATLAE